MKRLKKILLMNWLYFQKQIIEVDDINFLTGKNGAGKSTIIDALQIVFLGETNSKNFNKAANEGSQRSLDGYLRADMDPNNPYSRRGKDFSSYIACEFYDDVNAEAFVIGIIFDCRSDGGRQERYFSFTGTIPESCFLVGNLPMDIPALRKYLKSSYGARGKLFDTQKEYRSDMLAKWNLHTDQVCRMLKKAVSFKPITNIQEFITQNVCDVQEKLDITQMQQNIREYQLIERSAQREEDKLSALKEISKRFQDYRAAIDRYQIQSFLVLWAQRAALQERLDAAEQKREQSEHELSALSGQIEEIQTALEEQRRRKDELTAAILQDDVYQEEQRLDAQSRQLEEKQLELAAQLNATANEIRREAQKMFTLCETLSDTAAEELSALRDEVVRLESAFQPFAAFKSEDFSLPFPHFEEARDAVSALQTALHSALVALERQVEDLSREQREKQTVLENLRHNKKDYPRGLLRLRRELKDGLERRCGKAVPVEILADVLEIADGEDRWRGAVEGYLNSQKFYLLIPPEAYPEASKLYDAIKERYQTQSFGLVDIGKLRERERLEPWEDSLAKVVVTENPLARSYVDYLLGRVVCCERVPMLRRHRTAITPSGMLYQGYVMRPLRRSLMEDAFIGQKAIALRIERMERELAALEPELKRKKPLAALVGREAQQERLFRQYFVQQVVTQRQTDVRRAWEITRELEEIEKKKAQLNLFWVDQMREKAERLEEEIKALERQKHEKGKQLGGLEITIRSLEQEQLPRLRVNLSQKEEEVREQFSEADMEQNLPRYEQELKRLKKPSVIAENFGNSREQTIRRERSAREALVQARQRYVQTFQPCSFRVESEDNDEFDAERKLLEESELPRFREKIRWARESALEQFQNDFLSKLKSSIDQVQDQVRSLNKALRQAQFGTDRYQFKVERSPDYAQYYDMIMDPDLMEGEGGLFALPFLQKYGPLVEQLFNSIAASDDTQNARRQSELEENIRRFTDYRTYLRFDLETTDQNGNRQLLSQTLNAKSGGETQTPFYIAVLASFAQLYQVHSHSTNANNTVRLVIFDEAFNKMDSERIVESIRLLRKMHLQAIVCTPPDKLADIAPLTDKTYLVCKDKYQMYVLPFEKEVQR